MFYFVCGTVLFTVDCFCYYLLVLMLFFPPETTSLPLSRGMICRITLAYFCCWYEYLFLDEMTLFFPIASLYYEL